MKELQIRVARPDEAGAIIDIEQAAGRLFDPWRERLGFHNDEVPDPKEVRAACERGDLYVAGDDHELVGFCLLAEVDGQGHLQELDVHPEHGRHGIGRQILEFAANILRSRGYRAMTLTKFREVPWNRPFYEKAGFEIVESWGSEMQEVVAQEEASGIDFRRRCVMRRSL